MTINLIRQPRFTWAAIAFLFLFTPQTWAIDDSSKFQAHIRMGMLNGSYSGAGVGTRTFSTPTAIDVELEIFSGRDRSFNLRTMMAMELSTNVVNSTFGGMGQTFYLSRGKKDVMKENSVKITNQPTTRYYWGYSVGIAQVLVIQYGPVLGTYSTTLDTSANFGSIKQISDDLGFEWRLGLGMGYGFSSVTVTGMTTQALIGLTYFLK